METQTGERKPIGATMSIVIIVLILILGAYYFLRQVPPVTELLTSEEIQADKTISDLSTQGTSTDIVEIQKDLNATDFSNVGTGLSDIAL